MCEDHPTPVPEFDPHDTHPGRIDRSDDPASWGLSGEQITLAYQLSRALTRGEVRIQRNEKAFGFAQVLFSRIKDAETLETLAKIALSRIELYADEIKSLARIKEEVLAMKTELGFGERVFEADFTLDLLWDAVAEGCLLLSTDDTNK